VTNYFRSGDHAVCVGGIDCGLKVQAANASEIGGAVQFAASDWCNWMHGASESSLISLKDRAVKRNLAAGRAGELCLSSAKSAVRSSHRAFKIRQSLLSSPSNHLG
jgi:hypothetical protein